MGRFIEGCDRSQSTMFPAILDDYVGDDNPVRAIDVFVEGLDLGVLGYNVQVAVETENHLIITHEVTNSGSDGAQLARVGQAAKAVMQADTLQAVADRGYFNSPEILACHEAGITVTLPKPVTSGAKSEGRFGKQDFVFLPGEDAYRCPAGERPSIDNK